MNAGGAVSENDGRPTVDDAYEPGDELAPDLDLEEPEADAVEQRQVVAPGEDELPREVGLEVDAADAAEQGRVVEFDEDDYR
jgi:hypothetical protein